MGLSMKFALAAVAVASAAKLAEVGADALAAGDTQPEMAQIVGGDPSEPAPAAALAATEPAAGETDDAAGTTGFPEIGARGPVLPELLVAIAEERRALEAQRELLDTEAAEIDLARAALLRQHGELTALQAEMGRLLANLRTGHADDVDRLVKMYEAMKPAEAGAIMTDLDLEVATLVIAAMKESRSGPILARMEPQRAQIISKIIYERSKMPGDQKPVVVPRGG